MYDLDYEFVSGGISGAITDPNSRRALEHAEKFYAFIRNTQSDIPKIAENTNFTVEQVIMIKNFLFIDKHNLDGEIRLFDASFEIAQSWQRLAFMPDKIQPHDITLLNHELMEMRLMNDGLSQQEAHNFTEKKYNYTKESDLYYQGLLSNNTDQHSQTSGAILRKITH